MLFIVKKLEQNEYKTLIYAIKYKIDSFNYSNQISN